VRGRIAIHLDKGLGWTAPLFVASCGACGTELAHNTNQDAAQPAAGRTRCPACGTRTARRLPGITSPATDLALARGRRRLPVRRWRPPDPGPDPRPRRGATRHPCPPSTSFLSRPLVWKEPCHGSR
jgi:hypothetical protein